MNYIKGIREALKDPKKKSLVQLGLYGVFFIFVFILLNSGGSSNIDTPIIEEEKTGIEAYVEMLSYDYKVTYTNLNKIDIIEGTYYNNNSIFTYNNLKYYYEDSLYIIDNDSYYLSNIEYDITKIFNKNLYSIITNLEEESKTTYKDGKEVINYVVDSNKIYNYLYDLESNYTNLASVSITLVNDIVTNVQIDLTNLGLDLIKIEIEYSNIDNIESLEFNKDNYTYRESL